MNAPTAPDSALPEGSLSAPEGFTPDDLDTLARTLYGEARGETSLGKLAVACVVLNRLRRARTSNVHRRRWGGTVAEVCRKRKQFSCWLPGDPNLPKMLAVDGREPRFAECLIVARAALERFHELAEADRDPSGGADHYLNPAACNPDWDERMTRTATVGRHVFFRE